VAWLSRGIQERRSVSPEGYGEIIGGGERISNPELLLERIHRDQLPEEAFQWYLDLRRYGSVPHSGFGLGVERTLRVDFRHPSYPRVYSVPTHHG